jgi:hypothetical protein
MIHFNPVYTQEADADKSPMSADGALAASNLFKIIVESHLKCRLFYSI